MMEGSGYTSTGWGIEILCVWDPVVNCIVITGLQIKRNNHSLIEFLLYIKNVKQHGEYQKAQ